MSAMTKPIWNKLQGVTRHTIVLCSLVIAGPCVAQRVCLDEGWRFLQGDIADAEVVSFNDDDWRTLNVPHDWSVEGEFDRKHPTSDRCGYLPTGVGWYRKTIDVPDNWKNKRVAIQFDGVYRNSTVWANGKELGKRPYGWISFEYDISDLAQQSDTITFAVRVDNQRQHAARWYTGSGIYGHTWFDVRNPIHIPSSGIWLRTDGSTATIDTNIRNTTSHAETCNIKTTIFDANGNSVASVSSALDVPRSATQTVSQRLTIASPNRWSPENPYLYKAVSDVLVQGEVRDRVETRFGVRDIQWIPGRGMLLNGKTVKLQGVCQHQHCGALGAAVPTKIMRYRIEQMKAMGCNAIRTAHNPHTPQFYDLCDEIGMIVMDEFVDGWNRKAKHDYGAHHFDEWWKRDLTDWIRRDRNHPCVFLWSVGNETHGDIGEQLVAQCHKIDPTRPVTSGSSGSEFMDIYGMNGGSEEKGWFETKMPTDRVFIGTENTHTWQTRGYYRTQTWYRDGKRSYVADIPNLTDKEIFTVDWTDNANRANRKQFYKSSYDNSTVRSPARRAIAQIRDVPNNAGMFRWTGHDYLGEAGLASGAWPFRMFSGGAVDLANFEKDLYYLYQSQWTTSPMVHILPHWTHPAMKPGTEIPVWVYSNCDEVELFLDGQSLGKQIPGTQWQTMQCQWMVGWQPGSLTAIGYNEGRQVSQQTIRTADTPTNIQLSIDGEPLAQSGRDIVQVRASFWDAKNEFYPYGENRVWFKLNGPATLRALDNGKPNDVEPFHGRTDRTAFFGLLRAYVESTDQTGDISIVAGAILGDKKLFVSDRVSIDVQQTALRGNPSESELEVFYTTDGSTPNAQSNRYTGGFQVSLGTTVKAVAMRSNEPVLFMQERFASDVGLLWDGAGLDTDFGGEQAEDAEFAGASKSIDGRNYHGSGFLDMRDNEDAYVEWYRENDGDESNEMLTIRYSGKSLNQKKLQVRLNVNDQSIEKVLSLPPTVNAGKQWRSIDVPIRLQRGANTIRLSNIDKVGLLIDEIEFN
jgi:beta-galactosidase